MMAYGNKEGIDICQIQYDTMIIGPVSLDIMIDHEKNRTELVGGAVVQAGYAAANTGHKTAVYTKLNPADADVYEAFAKCPAMVYWRPSRETTSIQNTYFTADKETRECILRSRCDAFSAEELPPVQAEIYHFAGLVVGDFSNEMIVKTAKRGKVAVDVQCVLRREAANGQMDFHDWQEKREILPYISYLKTDAAEAQMLTGEENRAKAAKLLHEWGAGEVVITHNTEVLAYDGKQVYTCPIKARSLAGRTGRGDTTFAGYLNHRLQHSVEESLLFATALVSLKMETPGPFCKSCQDVLAYIEDFYR